jgi:hypothetical protein
MGNYLRITLIINLKDGGVEVDPEPTTEEIVQHFVKCAGDIRDTLWGTSHFPGPDQSYAHLYKRSLSRVFSPRIYYHGYKPWVARPSVGVIHVVLELDTTCNIGAQLAETRLKWVQDAVILANRNGPVGYKLPKHNTVSGLSHILDIATELGIEIDKDDDKADPRSYFQVLMDPAGIIYEESNPLVKHYKRLAGWLDPVGSIPKAKEETSRYWGDFKEKK